MLKTGQFHFALIPGADEAAFADLVRGKAIDKLQSTRITRGFVQTLLQGPTAGQYVWQVQADLMGNGRYDFPANGPVVQDLVKQHAVLIGVDTLVNVE